MSVDPSNLHLKKELTQIRKAARALRDPGTTSSWRSPLTSSRSTTTAPTNHYNHHYTNTSAYSVEEEPTDNNNIKDDAISSNNNNRNSSNANRRKEKKVFLYNWKTQRSESERSASVTGQTDDNRRRMKQRGNADDDDGIGDGEESVDDSLSDARNNDGGDLKTADHHRYALSSSSKMFNTCKHSNNLAATPPVRRASMMMKDKSKKMTHSSAAALKLQRRLSLVDQYDDDVTSEDIVAKGSSVTSPLLSRLKSSKLLGGSGSRKDDSSYCYSTPALSTSSFNKYWVRNPSTIGSWDATTGSLNDGDEGVDYHHDDDDDDEQLDLPGRQGCGIPCYWSSSKRSTPKRGGVCGSCYSPSFSDTLRRKGSSIFCGSQTMYHRHRGSSMGACNKKRLVHRTSQGLVPLLTNGAESRDRSSDEELSTNYGELDLEALSRLDGRRWSTSYRSQEGLELVAVNGEREGDSLSSLDNINCFSHKYKPMFFEDVVGQNVVVQSLVNAIMRGRIAPIYLFQGPRGTGKTSTARIFAAALNCLATGETRPCGICRECADYVTGKSQVITEMDGSNKKGIEKVRYLIKKLQMVPSTSAFIQHNVYVIDECHLLPSKLWLAFQKFLEEPPPSVVFIFITTDLDNVPRAVLSRCQKYLFSKIKDGDMVIRLRKIAEEENLDVESDAFDLIALNVEGSLRDAETMLDQLSLLGKRITTNLVNELVGVVSDEKLLELLELAMSSNTAETVKRARELMDLGVDPMVLMSQMATLIMDIIAGTYQVVEAGYGDSLFDGRSLTEAELERLKHALKLLSDSEKQLRLSSERSTWFTATLLQLGSAPSASADPTPSGSSRRQSSRTTDDDPSATFKDIYFQKQRPDSHYSPQKSAPITRNRNSISPEVVLPTRQLMNVDGPSVSNDDAVAENTIPRHGNSNILDDIWLRCIDKCHSKTLRQLLQTYGNLVSISEDKGMLVAYIVFQNSDIKSRAERFLSSITNSFEIVLRRNIEVRIIFMSDDGSSTPNTKNVLGQKQMELSDSVQEKGSFDDGGSKLISGGLAEGNGTKGRKSGNPVQRIESIIHEQRLETAWLQTAEKGTPGSLNRLKPERNQVLPQDVNDHQQRQMASNNPSNLSSQHQWEDELSRELNLLKMNDGKSLSREHNTSMSPSLLHDSNLVGKESMGYESGSGGGGGCLCWNKTKQNRRGKKMKPGTPVGPRRSARFLLFGECGKSGKAEQRSRR